MAPLMRPLWLLLLILLPAAAGRSQPSHLTWLEGTPGNTAVFTVDEARPGTPAAAWLAGVAVLDIELSNRTTQASLRRDRARRAVELGVPRLELPDNGRVLRYARAATGEHGFVWIGADGRPHLLLALTAGDTGGDPFADRCAVSADGRHLVITDAAGRAFAADLRGADPAVWRLGLPAPVEPRSVCVGGDRALLQTTDQRLWHIPLIGDRAAIDITPQPGPGAQLVAEMAPAASGHAVVLLQDTASTALYLAAPDGTVRALPVPVARYTAPGYLPEVTDGPRMLLSDDGSRLFFTQETMSGELFLLDTTGATGLVHLTDDSVFEPYIGTGIHPSFVGDRLVAAVGDPAFGFDWMTARTTAPVQNLTLSGLPGTPWWPGTLRPTAGYSTTAGGVLAAEPDPNGGTLLRAIDATAGTHVVVARDLRGAPGAGRAAAAPNLIIPSQRGDRFLNAALQPLLQSPAGMQLSADAQLPGTVATLFTLHYASGGGNVMLRLPNGAIVTLPFDPALRGLAVTPAGGVIIDGSELRYIKNGVQYRLASGSAPRTPLSHLH